jgi:hypothetical protein
VKRTDEAAWLTVDEVEEQREDVAIRHLEDDGPAILDSAAVVSIRRPPEPDTYVFDTVAIVTIHVEAHSPEEARRLALAYDGIEFTSDQTDVDLSAKLATDHYAQGHAWVSCISARTIQALITVTTANGSDLDATPHPQDGTLIADPEATPLRHALAAWKQAAGGPSADAEHEAADALASQVEAIVARPWPATLTPADLRNPSPS